MVTDIPAVLRLSSNLLLSPVTVSLLVVFLLSLVHYLCRQKVPVEKLPIPSGAELVWGHERLVYMSEPGHVLRKWMNEYGLIYRIKAAFGAKDVLVLSDPRAIAYILREKIYDYHHSNVVRPRVARLLGKGLGWVEGEAEHKQMRHLVSPSLSPGNVRAMSSDVRVAASRVVDDLVSHVQSRTEEAEGPMNVLDWTSKATLNVIGRVAFLHDFEGGNSSDAEKILHNRKRGVSSAVRYASFMVLMLLRRFPVLNNLPLGTIKSQAFAKIAIQSGVAHELVRRNQDVVDGSKASDQSDLLSRLLVSHAASKISKEELYEQISTFIVSGLESTSQTLGFTLFEISRHPDVQDRLREEIKAFPGEPTYDDFQTRLPYLDAVLKEILRLYPALPYMERIATKEDSIPLRDPVKLASGEVITQIPVLPGQVVLIPIISIHRMDSVWDDPDVFRPERWLGELPATEELSSGWANTLPFSAGPRNCIGVHLAIFQYKVILSCLMERFKFGDAEMDITLKIASSLQAWVVGQPELGACLPVKVELL